MKKRADAVPGVALLRASEIRLKPIKWLWSGWVAGGKLAILAGAPGTGKTTLALSLASTLTNAGQWPDGTPCKAVGSVLIWSGEDGEDDTLAVRLEAAGADMTRVYFVQGRYDADGDFEHFDPAAPTQTLIEALASIGDVAMVIIDPIVSSVAGDSHKSNQVRRSLQPLIDIAAESGCAILGITHFSKSTAGRNPLERVTGSIAFGALARVVMVTAGTKERRVVARAKSNIGPDSGGLVYSMEITKVSTDDGDTETNRVKWIGGVDGDALAILNKFETGESPQQHDEVAEFVKAQLANGPVPADDMYRKGQVGGITEKQLRAALKRAGGKHQKVGVPGEKQYWEWRLPTAQNNDQ